MKISVFGTGYVGLVTGTCFAELGNEVLCFDIDKKKISMLKKGEVPIYEPGLSELVVRNCGEGRLAFTNDEKVAVDFGSIIFIAVGTPSNENGDVNLDFVASVAKTIGRNIYCDGKIIVNKSTVPVGTAKFVHSIISKEIRDRDENFIFGVASNPEFLKEGTAIDDFMRPDRIVVGSEDGWVRDLMQELYNPLVKNGHPIFLVDFASAEMSKYASNAFLATKISFMNEVSAICRKTGADVENVRKIMSADRRIGNQFLYPGIGYGGSCFPKDVLGLASTARKNGFVAKITEAVDVTNKEQRLRFFESICEELKDLSGKKIAVWGLSFKPNTDDMREAPSVTIINLLIESGARVVACDPVAGKEAKKIFGDKILFEKDKYACIKNADALVVVTEWPQFKAPDFDKMRAMMKTPVIFDGRNIYSLEQMEKLGFVYVSVGRGRVGPVK